MNKQEAGNYIEEKLKCVCKHRGFIYKDDPDENKFNAMCTHCGVTTEIAYEKEEKIDSLDHHLNRANFHIGYAIHAIAIELSLEEKNYLSMMKELALMKTKLIQFLEMSDE